MLALLLLSVFLVLVMHAALSSAAEFLNVPFFVALNASDDCMIVPERVTTDLPTETACKLRQPSTESSMIIGALMTPFWKDPVFRDPDTRHFFFQMTQRQFSQEIVKGYVPEGTNLCICFAPSASDMTVLSDAGFTVKPNSKGYSLGCGRCGDKGTWTPIVSK